jgi:hypothetical protein
VVNQVCHGKKSLIPIFQGHGGVGKKSEAHLHNVMMLALSISILLMSVRTRELMGDANVAEKGIKSRIPHPNLIGP